MRFHLAAAAALASCMIVTTGRAQNPNPMDIRGCTAIESNAQRLACYDQATGRNNLPAAQKRQVEAAAAGSIFARDSHAALHASGEGGHDVATPLSLLDSRWELSRESKLGTFNVRGYQPVYVLPFFGSSNQNNRPHIPGADNTPTADDGLENVEAKFQLSLKTKLWQGVFGDAGDIWVGYTQSSRWQAYNTGQSRPFRETNYEPEVMLVFRTDYQVLGWRGRLLGIGLDHQSNGRGSLRSRSWNRVIADVGFEREGWTVMLRPWWRLPESGSTDDNPGISDYIGRGELQIVHVWHGQEFGLALRDSFRGGSRQHGSARFSWSFPIAGNLRGHAEVFKGYGESLIDYNHNATYLGLGVSLLDWY